MAKSGQPRRGASRSPGKTQRRRQVPGWVWLFAGVMVGLFVAFLVHLGDVQMQQGTPAGQAAQQPHADNKDSDTATDDDGQPKFDFYAVLPKMEVIVPKGSDDKTGNTHSAAPQDNDAPSAATDTTATHTAPRSDKRYMLQAGSFRSEADADRRRARLTLRGFDVSIQPVQLDNGNTWHRVMVGPYASLGALRTDQDKLIEQGVETLPIQIKKP